MTTAVVPRTSRPPYPGLDSRTRQTLERLVQQQFWLFGADIRRPAGNLLLQLGFERHRAPDPPHGSSCYVLADPGVGIVHLWGFGCCLTSEPAGRIFLTRHRAKVHRIPDTIALEGLHSVPELHRLCHRDEDDAGLPVRQAALFRWFADYERNALDHMGLPERNAMLAQWTHRRACPVTEIPERWERMASAIVSAMEPGLLLQN
ncbi:MAG: hypothetical protein M9947_14865 [Thermomicrobiales bacterium]|nr:hypothetical protein [Thermomicrobiales bacterium]